MNSHGLTERQAEVCRIYEETGNVAETARRLGVARSTVQDSLRGARKRGWGVDPAMRTAMDAVGAGMEPSVAWIKTKLSREEAKNGGTEFSVLMRRREPDPEEEGGLADRLHDLFTDVPQVDVKVPQEHLDAKHKFALIPINDLHAGAYAWGDETNSGDWDTDKAVDRLREWTSRLYHRMSPVEEVILLFNGDTLHANDHKALTPKSHNILDVDTRHFRTVDQLALGIITAVDMAAAMFPRVRLVIRPGNHDPTAYLSLLMAAKWRYYKQPNVEVDQKPGEFWAYRRGQTFLFSHHGDKAKPEKLVMAMAAEHPREWGESRYRYVWTGDKHHRASERIGGAMWEQASCLTERDAYAASGGYPNSPELQAVIYHDMRGEIERYRVSA